MNQQYELNGVRGTLPFFAKKHGINYLTLYRRVSRGMSLEEAINTPREMLRARRGACVVSGCDRKVRKIGEELCVGHAYRLTKYGSVDGQRRVVTREKAYGRWQNMLASGVDVGWDSYDEFSKDMGEPPRGREVLCRYDWSIGYCKENCFWGTKAQSRHVRMIEIDGIEDSIVGWSKRSGLSTATLNYRLKHGWTGKKLLKGAK